MAEIPVPAGQLQLKAILVHTRRIANDRLGPPSMIFPEIERITIDRRVMGGKPCIRGMRVTIGTITGLLASGADRAEILRLYPYLEPGDIAAALAYATWPAEERDLPLETG